MKSVYVFVIYDLFNKELPVALFDTHKQATDYLEIGFCKYDRNRVYKGRYLIIKVNISR